MMVSNPSLPTKTTSKASSNLALGSAPGSWRWITSLEADLEGVTETTLEPLDCWNPINAFSGFAGPES